MNYTDVSNGPGPLPTSVREPWDHREDGYCRCLKCEIARWDHCTGWLACTCWRCLPAQRRYRACSWGPKDDQWVLEQVGGNLEYVLYRYLLWSSGVYDPDEWPYDPDTCEDLVLDPVLVYEHAWSWLREVLLRAGVARHLPRVKRALDRALAMLTGEKPGPSDYSEVDRAVDRQFDDEWGWAVFESILKGTPSEHREATARGLLVLALLIGALASVEPISWLRADLPAYRHKPYLRESDGPIVPTGPPASTWASPLQVLPVLAA